MNIKIWECPLNKCIRARDKLNLSLRKYLFVERLNPQMKTQLDNKRQKIRPQSHKQLKLKVYQQKHLSLRLRWLLNALKRKLRLKIQKTKSKKIIKSKSKINKRNSLKIKLFLMTVISPPLVEEIYRNLRIDIYRIVFMRKMNKKWI